jgi:hypothetical protein
MHIILVVIIGISGSLGTILPPFVHLTEIKAKEVFDMYTLRIKTIHMKFNIPEHSMHDRIDLVIMSIAFLYDRVYREE